jgi:2-hydroxy-6-oxonona-2,4-dienedioate hydrolase
MKDAPTATEGYAEVNGARLWYEVAGVGPTLVMAHGHLIDSGQWDGQFAEFAREFRVVRYDARGFGHSDKPAHPFAFHEDLRALLVFLRIERPLLMGCSGGGATIIDLTLTYPDIVRGLVVVGTALSGYQFAGSPPPKIVAMREAQERGDIDAAVELGLQVWTDGARRRPEQVNRIARERTREMMTRLYSRPTVAADVRRLDPPAIGRLREIRVPTLVVIGADDWQPIHDIADQLAMQVPGARKLVIPDAGHHPNIEHPEQFNEWVLPFLRSIPD